MIKKTAMLWLLCVGVLWAGPADREKVSLNGLWDFYPDGGTERHEIRVPSFWDAPQDYGFPMDWLHMGHGIYRKQVTIPNSMQDKQIFLEIRRVSVIAKVFINGTQVGGETSGGYLMMQLPYLIDITALARVGQSNEIEVRVWGSKSKVKPDQDSGKELREESGFPPDALDEGRLLYPWGVDDWDGRRGINGDVSLVATPKCYVSDVFVLPELHKNQDPGDDEISLQITVTNKDHKSRNLVIRNRALHVGGKQEKTFAPVKVTVPANSEQLIIINNVLWSDAQYWWPHSPQLYDLHTDLTEDSQMVDTCRTRFGFRQFYVRGNTFELNGIRANLRGDAFEFSWHEGYRHGPYSPVISTKELAPVMQRRLLTEYQKLNLNVLRPHKASGIDELYDWCDEIGMMVMDETPFWQTHHRTDERARANFEDWMRRMVKARRNHPSLIMWVAANECYKGPIPMYAVQAAKATDPTRPVIHDDGFKKDNAPGDEANYHYTGGFPMGALFKDDLYNIYTNHDHIPTGEGEAAFGEGWPLLQADGAFYPDGKRCSSGDYQSPDVISQAQWLRQACRLVRAMRYTELADIRLYANWMFCFDPIAAVIYPEWSDPSAPGIQPKVLHLPLCNVFSDRYPEVLYNEGRVYHQNTHAPVAVFDKQWDGENRMGAPFVLYASGQKLTRELLIYNDEFHDGEHLEVTYELRVTNPSTSQQASNTSQLAADVPYGHTCQRSITLEIPSGVTGSSWLDLILSARKNGQERFREVNRIGVVNAEPAPQLSLVQDSYDLGDLPAGQLGYWYKLKLINRGGGQSLKWTVSGMDKTIQVAFNQGNLRREQDLYFRVDTSDLSKGRYENRLVFTSENAGSAVARISFQVK